MRCVMKDTWRNRHTYRWAIQWRWTEESPPEFSKGDYSWHTCNMTKSAGMAERLIREAQWKYGEEMLKREWRYVDCDNSGEPSEGDSDAPRD